MIWLSDFFSHFSPRRKIISSLAGGLGNQMFQYSAGRALATKFNRDLVLDTSLLRVKGDHTPRTYALNAFKIRASVDGLDNDWLEKVQTLPEEQASAGWPKRRRVKGDLLLTGHWQSECYFASIRQQLITDFALTRPPSRYIGALAQKIQCSSNSVSLHFRRGDYVTNPVAASFHGTCSLDYYHAALARLNQQVGELDLYVFSDEPEWVRREAKLPAGYTLVDCEQSSPAEDIWLMSLCRHHVIANSSFSWWGAWLGCADGMTFAPAVWFLEKAAAQSHIVPSRWERL